MPQRKTGYHVKAYGGEPTFSVRCGGSGKAFGGGVTEVQARRTCRSQPSKGESELWMPGAEDDLVA